MLLKEEADMPIKRRIEKERKRRKKGLFLLQEGIVSVMFKNLQLAAGAYHAQKEFVVGE